MATIDAERPASLEPTDPLAELAVLPQPDHDMVAEFRPAVFAIRAGTTIISVVLATPSLADRNWTVIAWCTVIVAYNVFRLICPVKYVSTDTPSLLRVLFEVVIHVMAVVATGYWQSPLVFALITAVMVAGFARGFGFALRVSLASALAVSIPAYFSDLHDADRELRTAAQWTGELILVALLAGYAGRITGEVDRQHTIALDRLGRLADANLLLHSLHEVTQTLPASLDVDDVLDSTMNRLKDLFEYDGATLLLIEETQAVWSVARWDGPRPAPTYTFDTLPAMVQEALTRQVPVMASKILPTSPGIAVEMSSGLYAPLLARDQVMGLIALEHSGAHHFRSRDRELLQGFVEPAALAIDNARWFSRLRTVGADEERTRIARDLHDRIGQSLAYLAFELDRIVKTNERGDDVTGQLEHLRSDVRGVIGEVRDTLYDLRTDVTDSRDMTDVLREFLDRVRDRSTLEVSLDAQDTERLPLLQEREMWRIAQEAVTNVERHARASRIIVTWRSDGERATLVVVDDGVGFPSEKVGRLDSYGIIGMRERSVSIGATLDIVSDERTGTTVRCEVRP